MEELFESLKESVSEQCFDEIMGLVEEILNNEGEPKKGRKSNKQFVYMRQDDPARNKIGVRKKYNRVIHNDNPDDPYSYNYVKIKGARYSVDSRNNINQRLN